MYEPGLVLAIPTRYEPERGLSLETEGCRAATGKGVNHRTDGDRHERSAGASGSGGDAVAGVSAGKGRRGALRLDRVGAATLGVRAVAASAPRARCCSREGLL